MRSPSSPAVGPSPSAESLESRTLFSVTPNDELFPRQWWMQKVSAPQAWDITTGSTAVVVDVNDTGIDYTHPDLYRNVWLNQAEVPFPVGTTDKTLRDTDGDGLITFWDLNANDAKGKPVNGKFARDLNRNGYIDAGDLLADPAWADGVDEGGNGYVDDLIGWDFVNNDNDPMDDNGHGTRVASIVAEQTDNGIGGAGLNWRAQLMATKVFGVDADFPAGGRAPAVAGTRYAADNGARVGNNSWVYHGGLAGDDVYRSVEYAAAKGMLFVAAAGNDGWNNDKPGDEQRFPASFDLPSIISVAASTVDDKLWSLSNYGHQSVDLAAPGDGVGSAYPVALSSPSFPYALGSGTSLAAPFVAGTAALMLARNPGLTSAQLKDLILSTVDQGPAFAGKTVTGGRLNVYRALAAVPATAAPAARSAFSATPVSTPSQWLATADARRVDSYVGSAGTLADDSDGSQQRHGAGDGVRRIRVVRGRVR